MKILKGNYGECRFCDCNNDLPNIDKIFDLCWADPPYNIRFRGIHNWKNPKIVFYKDDLNPIIYKKNITTMMQNTMLKSRRQLYYGGSMNLSLYLNYKTTREIGYIIKQNLNGLTAHPIICYNEKAKTFISKNNQKRITENHPCPLPAELLEDIFTQYGAKSILDPYLGSGPTAEVCESLGIPWLGYELKEEYAPDIKRRIKHGIKKSKQKNLTSFF